METKLLQILVTIQFRLIKMHAYEYALVASNRHFLMATAKHLNMFQETELLMFPPIYTDYMTRLDRVPPPVRTLAL